MKFTETSATGVSDVTGVSGDSAAGPPLSVGAGGKSSWSSGANGYAVTDHSAALASESLPLAPTCVLVCGDSAIRP